jgi:hypothetical protein
MNIGSPQPAKNSARIILIALVLFTFVFVFFSYTFLHESGHALTGLAFGQRLSGFDVSFWDFSAHVDLSGEISDTQRAAQSAAGAGLPLMVWLICICLVPRKASFSIETLKLIGSMGVLNTLLAWIAIPVLTLVGRAPMDDVTNFLGASRMPPLLLLALALLLYAAGWRLFLAKIDGLRNEFLLFSETDPAILTAGARPVVSVMSGLALGCVALSLGANSLAAKNPIDRLSPPPGFQIAVQVDLSKMPHSNETLARFTLDNASNAGVFVIISEINTPYFDLSIQGPDGFKETILHGEGYRAERDGGLWEKNLLPAGEYQVVLNSQTSSGKVSIYLRLPSGSAQ